MTTNSAFSEKLKTLPLVRQVFHDPAPEFLSASFHVAVLTAQQHSAAPAQVAGAGRSTLPGPAMSVWPLGCSAVTAAKSLKNLATWEPSLRLPDGPPARDDGPPDAFLVPS